MILRCKAEIDLDALCHNLAQVRARNPEGGVMAIVKANAYGHGIRECSARLRACGAAYLGVAFIDEARVLRESGDTGPLLVLTAPLNGNAELYCRYNIDFAACSAAGVEHFAQQARAAGCVLRAHLYLDTGMHRDGIDYREAANFMRRYASLPGIEWVGICTHFATSEEADQSFALEQLERFNTARRNVQAAGFTFRYIHAGNSGAVSNVPGALFNLVRPGSALYGYNASDAVREPFHLRPVMRLSARVNAIRELEAGEPVSYGRRYYTRKPTRIATLAIGYGDGFHRCMSGKVQCLLHGRRYDIVGVICMDECMVDIGSDDIAVGDEAVLIGTSGSERIPATELAEYAGTIHYEILSGITERVPRIYLTERRSNGSESH